MAVLERPDGGTRLTIETDRALENTMALEGSVLSINFKDVAATPRELKALETNPSTGAVQGVRAFYAPKDKNLLLKVTLRALAPTMSTATEIY